MVHFILVFELLAKDKWNVKLSKCAFTQRKISYLGQMISEHGVGTGRSKIAAIASWPSPSSAKELKSLSVTSVL